MHKFFILFLLCFNLYAEDGLERKPKSFSFSIGKNYETENENIFGNFDSLRVHETFQTSGEFEENIILNDMYGYYDKNLLPNKRNFQREWNKLLNKGFQKGVLYASLNGKLNSDSGLPEFSFQNGETFTLTELLSPIQGNDTKLFLILDVCTQRSTFYNEKKEEEDGQEESKDSIKLQKINPNISVILSSNDVGRCFLDPKQSGSPFTNFFLETLNQKNNKKKSFYKSVLSIQKKWEVFQNNKGVTKPYSFFVWNESEKSPLLEDNINPVLSRLLPYSIQENGYFLSSILFNKNQERIYQINYRNESGALKSFAVYGLAEIFHKYNEDFYESKEFLSKGEPHRFFGWRETEPNKEYKLEHLHNSIYANSIYKRKNNRILLSRHSETNKNLLDDGISWIEYKLSQGFLILKSYIIKDDKYAKNQKGISISKYNYDERGNLLIEEFFNDKRKLVENEEKIAKYFYEYGTSGNLDSVRHYNKYETYINHKPARILYKHNEKGSILSLDYLNRSESPTQDENGIQRIEYSYSELGKISMERYLGAGGSLKKTGYAFKVFTYNEKAELLEIQFLNAWKQSTYNEQGISTYKYQYDEKSRLISESYFNEEGEKAIHPEGYHLIEYIYDNHGVLLKESFLDKERKPTVNKKKISSVEYVYSPEGELIGKEFYNLEGYLLDAKYQKTFSNVLNSESKKPILIHFDKFFRPTQLEFFEHSAFQGGPE